PDSWIAREYFCRAGCHRACRGGQRLPGNRSEKQSTDQFSDVMMKLLKFVFRTCRGMLALTAFAALLSGACNGGLLGLVNNLLNNPGLPTPALACAFIGLGQGQLL